MPQSKIYLDYAAATPINPLVLAAMEPYFSDKFYNPSATYELAIEARKALMAARQHVASWLGARSTEIVFTAGGTEANNLAIHGIMRQFLNANIVVSTIEHESILAPAGKYDVRYAAVQSDGRLDIDDLQAKIDDQTVLVSIMYANNEIGSVQPLREVAKIIRQKRDIRSLDSLPLYLHTDACQAANYLDLHTARLGVDLLTLNGGKIYGPKQSGVLFVKTGTKILPLIDGGGQERGLRSGTENVSSSIGLAAALQAVQANRHLEVSRLRKIQLLFIDQVEKNLPSAFINGSKKYRLPNNVHLTLPGRDNERLLFQLEAAGILAAAGSACSASDETPSHVLRALGFDDKTARASLRFTMGQGTTSAMIDRVSAVLHSL